MIGIDRLLVLLFDELPRAVAARRLRSLVARGVVSLGEGTYGIPRVLTFRGNAARLVVGPYVSITSGATILLGGNHPTPWVSLYPFRARLSLPGAYSDGMPETRGDVIIEADAWIGHEALIMSGVRIGVGAAVAARAVVTRSVPDFAVVAGNPAQIVKFRFPEDVRMRILATRWWEMPREQLVGLVPLLSSGEIQEFLRKFEQQGSR
jgi:virginiamycin A acetyltransferase